MQILLRPLHISLDREKLYFLKEKLLDTTYHAWSIDSDAPESTDCVTALRYLLRYSSDFVLPHAYIWDLPHILIQEKLCRIVSLSEGECGDLIFFEKMSKTHKKYMITHVGLMLDRDSFFHSSLLHNGSTSHIDDDEYMSSILEESFLSLARDPRHYA